MKINNFKKFIIAAFCAVIFIIACEKADMKSEEYSLYYAIDSVSADGSADKGTTALTITVNDDKLVLTADDIKINAAFTVIKGGIKKTDTAKTYELSITPGGTGTIRAGLDPYRGFTGWDAKTAAVYAEWYFNGTSELTITGCGLSAFPFEKIPLEIAGLPVTAIGNMAFYNEGLTNVIIGDGIKIIGENAFAYNHLSKIVIPESVVAVGSGAFEYNRLSCVIIPKNVTIIKSSVFANNLLTKIDFRGDVISIGEEAFADNQLNEIIIPDSVKNIDTHAFIENPLISITIGENVTLGRYSFGNGFESAYNYHNKQKGTYTFIGDSWIYSPLH